MKLVNQRILVWLLGFMLLFSAAWVFIGKYIYETAANVNGECWGNLSNRPDRFHSRFWGIRTEHDLSEWWFGDYQEVELTLENEALRISAWVREAEGNAPWILFIHGLGSCKNNHAVLLPAAMMVRQGYSVMLLDMREHGASSRINQLHTAGQEELHDVLNGWRWIHEKKGIPAEEIGVYGVSLGAGTVALAFAEEPRIHAAWLDSPFADMEKIIRSELQIAGFPAFLAGGAKLAGLLFSGIDIMGRTPLEGAESIGNRHLFIAHGKQDERIPVFHGELMCETANAFMLEDGSVECWYPSGQVTVGEDKTTGHAVAMLTELEEWNHQMKEFFGRTLNHQN
ncbi:MAG: alpha/beta hydrolase [SAR324 cluster bacterium]|jgi:pimeloyl-ACP methyl ester carboxylesterase|nr:alpha/beta hydrolase [SAR324 cluster bacterium]|tara:strand:- start:2754 stop:3773 length:1020 start_codon:yes stop_codon:yes gene_type:complete